jgi:hypothetical protein
MRTVVDAVLATRSSCLPGAGATRRAGPGTGHDADRLLAEELGTEPGRELRQLHADALAGTTTAVPRSGLLGSQDGLARVRLLLTEALAIVAAGG